MKIITLILMIFLSYNLYAQKSIFVRVYDLSGKKIHKGNVFAATDTLLQLEGKFGPVDIPVRNIGSIRTKRSAGNNVLVGAIVAVSSLAILGAATADPDALIIPFTAAEGAAAGALIGLPVGAAIGGLTIIFKNTHSYLIDGDTTKWKTFEVRYNGKRR